MRARNIKPGFYKNADLAECSVMSRFLFPGLWMLADREGRLEDRPKQIKGEIFPFDDADVNALIDELAGAGMLLRYIKDGKKYIQILNFSKHQRPHANETKSEIPEFSDTCTKVESTCNQGEKHFALNDITSSLNPSLLNDESLNAPIVAKRERNRKKISLKELSVDHIADWLADKRKEGRYIHHNETDILEYFKTYCESKNKRYDDYVAALRLSFDWERNQPKGNTNGQQPTFHTNRSTVTEYKSRSERAKDALRSAFPELSQPYTPPDA
jgi:hypothetical protein